MIIDSRSPQGNAFAIISAVHELFRLSGRRDEFEAVRERMMSGDYEHLCRVAEEVSHGSIVIERGPRDYDEDDY